MVRVSTCHALGDVVRQERVDQNLTQTDLAGRAGVSRPWLSQLENGKRTVELHKVLAIVDALGLCLDVVPKPPNPTGQRIDKMLEDLSPGGDHTAAERSPQRSSALDAGATPRRQRVRKLPHLD